MSDNLVKVPFVDLSWQNQPLLAEINQMMMDVCQRGDFILGKEVREFETDFASACGVTYGVGVGSGTDAIALGLMACGVGAGDEVIVPANTFIATIIGVILAQATPILVDCDPQTALIDLSLAQKAVTKRTKAIIPVHLYGQMVSPSQLKDFGKTNNIIIFEDSAQAHLAVRENCQGGSIGLASGFSFYPSKNLGAFGNGGMLVTDNENIAQKVRSLRNYGAPKKYYHRDFGTNSRLDTLQGVVLKKKLPLLKTWNSLRNEAGQKYDQLLEPLQEKGITPIKNVSGKGHVYHLYVIKVVGERCNRDVLQEKLAEWGIQTGIHYPIPCHLQPAYGNLGYREGDFPHSEDLCRNILSLPMYPGITDQQIELVVNKINHVLS